MICNRVFFEECVEKWVSMSDSLAMIDAKPDRSTDLPGLHRAVVKLINSLRWQTKRRPN